MSFGNDSLPSGGQAMETPNQTQTPQPPNMSRQVILRPEEVAMYKSCTRELYFKIGLPFAVCFELIASRFSKKPVVDQTATRTFAVRGFRFLGNILIGGFLGTPICYRKLVTMREEFLRNHPEYERQGIDRPERVPPLTPSKDLGYPAQMPNPDDLESSFSSDFSTTKLISDEPENVKTSKTTYQELRARHRSGSEGYRRPPSPLEPAPANLGTFSTTDDKPLFDEPPSPSPPPPPQKIVKRTKYGDEME